MRVYLAEKRRQASAIADALGGARGRGPHHLELADGARVVWAQGHLLELAPPDDYDPKWRRWDVATLPIDPPQGGWRLVPTGDAKTKALQRAVVASLGRASEIVICTDAGREGELIAWNLIEAAGAEETPQRRLWSTSMDPGELRGALANLKPGEEKHPYALAGQVRSRADWLEGMNLTRMLTRKCCPPQGRGVVSVGRVQTPVLALVVRREREREAFRPEPRFALRAKVHAGPHRLVMEHRPEPPLTKEADAKDRARQAAGATGPVEVRRSGEKRQGPPKPYDLASLQAAMNARYGWTAQNTLDVAQKLYEERSALSYPRTDCRAYAAAEWDLTGPIGRTLAKLSAQYARLAGPEKDWVKRASVWSDRALAGHDHGALRPAKGPFDATGWSDEERRLFDEVTRRYLMQLMPDWCYEETVCRLDANGVELLAKGRATLRPGWRDALRAGADAATGDAPAGVDQAKEDQVLDAPPDGTPGEVQGEPEVLRWKTKPPPRYREGTLVRRMVQLDLGTQSTWAATLEKLKARGYVRTEARALAPTPLGSGLVQLVEQHAAGLAEPATTRALEKRLHAIEAGNEPPGQVLAELRTATFAVLEGLRGAALPHLPMPVEAKGTRKGTKGRSRRSTRS